MDRTAGIDFVISRSDNQTTAALLATVAADPDRLGSLLEAGAARTPTPEETEGIRKRLADLYAVARSAKTANGVLFFTALVVFLAATLWPAMSLAWDPMEDDFLNGLAQSAVFVVGGLCLAAYRIRKLRQTAIEDAMRRTLVQTESLEEKTGRLDALMRSAAERRRRRREKRGRDARPWRAESTTHLLTCLEDALGRPPSAGEALAIATELKEAGIKAHSYRWISATMTVLTGLAVIGGLALPLTIPLLGWRGNPSFLGMAQALLVLGLGPLFFGIRKQYATRRRRLIAEMRRVLGRSEPFEEKAIRIPDALIQIDTGWSREG